MYDPLDFALSQWEIKQEEMERNQPKCDKCGEPLTDGEYYEIEMGEQWCEACAEEWLEEQKHQL